MSLLLQDVRLVDVERGRVLPNTSVLIEGTRIVQVAPVSEVAANGETLDCEGRFLLPGLVDAHIHLRGSRHRGPSEGEPVPSDEQEQDRREVISRLHSYLYCGVTSVFDAGNDEGLIYPLREEVAAGSVLGPRIFCAGAIVTCSGGHGTGLVGTVAVDDLPADLPRLREHFRGRPDLVKVTYDEHGWGVRPLIPVLERSVLAGIIAAAHEAMLRVTVHTSNELRAREALGAGADALAHPVIQSPATPELAWMLASRQTPVVSTLAIGERYARLADSPGYVDEPMYAACIDAEERERLRVDEHRFQSANRWADWMRVMTPVAQENLRALVAAGGVVATGTDLSLGPEMHRELYLLQAAGIAPLEVLRCATLHGATFLGARHDLGTVETGKLADLVIVDEDPTRDVGALQSIFMVLKGGSPVARERLDLPGAGRSGHRPIGQTVTAR